MRVAERRPRSDAQRQLGQVADGASRPRRSSRARVAGPTPHSADDRQRVQEGQLLARRHDHDARARRRRPPAVDLGLGRLRGQLGQQLRRRHARAARELQLRRRRRAGAAPAIAAAGPNSRRAPVTSRKASSREIGSTSGRVAPEDRLDLPAHLLVAGVVAGQEHRLRAQPPGDGRRHGRVDAEAPGLVGRRRHHAPLARRRRRRPAGPAAPAGAAARPRRRTRPCRRGGWSVRPASRRSPGGAPARHGSVTATGGAHAANEAAGSAGAGDAARRRRGAVRTSRTPQPVTSANASRTMGSDILDSPARRSTKATGISTTRPPWRMSR